MFLLFINFSGLSQSRLSEFCVIPSEVQIRPNASDFDTDGIGRVLISDDQGDYYTGLQSADRALTILVYLPDQFKGEMVYFTIHDPDDPSDYEPDTTPGDNNCTGDASLQYNNVRALQYSIFGTSFPLAINRLVITNRCSGDNYQVLCSLTPPDPVTGLFPSDAVVYSSIVYTAWKRIYVNYAEMYKRGSFVNTIDPNKPTYIYVNSKEDFIDGEKIKFVGPDGVIKESTGVIIQRSNTSAGPIIELSENFINYNVYDRVYSPTLSVTEVNKTQSFDYSTSLIESSYGDDCSSISGETFVNIKISDSGIKIPCFSRVPSNFLPPLFYTDSGQLNIYKMYLRNWGLGFNYNNNIIDFLAAVNVDDKLFGVNIREFGNVNVAHVFEVKHSDPGIFNNAAMVNKETYVHELAHLFNVLSSHVDVNTDVFERCNNVRCIMTRPPMNNLQLRYDGITNFDELSDGCIYDIRKAINPR